MNNTLQAMAGGFAGAGLLTIAHETIRQFNPDAPRMDILGMRALLKVLPDPVQVQAAESGYLHTMALAADLVSNTLYYSLAGTGKNALWRGAVLGAAAGAGALALPGPMGLGTAPSNRTTQTQVLSFCYYFGAGLVAGALGLAMGKRNKK